MLAAPGGPRAPSEGRAGLGEGALMVGALGHVGVVAVCARVYRGVLRVIWQGGI